MRLFTTVRLLVALALPEGRVRMKGKVDAHKEKMQGADRVACDGPALCVAPL